MNGKRLPNGFTLIELVLVLVILSVLATLALQSVEPQIDQARFEATQSTIAKVQQGLIDVQRGALGASTITGFVADMGRLPQARDEGDAFTVSELWLQETLLPYRSLNAETANLTTGMDSDGDTIRADADVRMTFGWRGPYIQFPPGGSELRDGWGHRLVTRKGEGVSHLRGLGDTDISAVGDPVYGVRSFGRSDLPGTSTADPYEDDIPASGQLTAVSAYSGYVTGTVYLNGSTASADNVVVQLFYPEPTAGEKIAAECASSEASVAGDDCSGTASPATEISGSGPADPSDANKFSAFTFRFDDGCGDDRRFIVGPRVLRAYLGTTEQSVPLTVNIAPGHNQTELTINATGTTN